MNYDVFLRETSLYSRTDAMLKVTALQYLKDALLKEEYESCRELLERARNFGAQEGEIAELLAAASQNKGGEPGEASRGNNRLFK